MKEIGILAKIDLLDEFISSKFSDQQLSHLVYWTDQFI